MSHIEINQHFIGTPLLLYPAIAIGILLVVAVVWMALELWNAPDEDDLDKRLNSYLGIDKED